MNVHYLLCYSWLIILFQNIRLICSQRSKQTLANQEQTSLKTSSSACRFAHEYNCESFTIEANRKKYLESVIDWESKFASAGVGFDEKTGFTYEGHIIQNTSNSIAGYERILVSSPTQESIHLSILLLALNGNVNALRFCGGLQKVLTVLTAKVETYLVFNDTFPGYGCFMPWVEIKDNGTVHPAQSWMTPHHMVPSSNNGLCFWSIYAVVHALSKKTGSEYIELTNKYRKFSECQKGNAPIIFYTGNRLISAVSFIVNAYSPPHKYNYAHGEGYLDDPYKGEAMTQVIYLFSDWSRHVLSMNDTERELIWEKKREMLQPIDLDIPYIPNVTPDIYPLKSPFRKVIGLARMNNRRLYYSYTTPKLSSRLLSNLQQRIREH